MAAGPQMISADYVRRIVDAAPPLRDEQRAVISAQLRPAIEQASPSAPRGAALAVDIGVRPDPARAGTPSGLVPPT